MGSPAMQDVMKQIAAFTDVEPLHQFDEIVELWAYREALTAVQRFARSIPPPLRSYPKLN